MTLKTEDGGQSLDGIVLDRGGIRLVRAYGWGTKIYGKPDGEMWRREDPKRKEEFKNPLFELNAAAELIKNALKDQGMEKITVTPLVVFADNYQIPELYLGYGSCSTTYQELKDWYKKQGLPKEAAYDVEKASAAVEGLLTGRDRERVIYNLQEGYYMINEKRLLDTFLEYVQIDSETKNEKAMGERLVQDLKALGFEVQTDRQERPLAPTASMSMHF